MAAEPSTVDVDAPVGSWVFWYDFFDGQPRIGRVIIPENGSGVITAKLLEPNPQGLTEGCVPAAEVCLVVQSCSLTELVAGLAAALPVDPEEEP